MAKSNIDPAYFQVAHPSEGGTIPAHKNPANPEDALGNPGRLTRNLSTVATAQPDSETKKVIDKQLGTNIELTWVRTKES